MQERMLKAFTYFAENAARTVGADAVLIVGLQDAGDGELAAIGTAVSREGAPGHVISALHQLADDARGLSGLPYAVNYDAREEEIL